MRLTSTIFVDLWCAEDTQTQTGTKEREQVKEATTKTDMEIPASKMKKGGTKKKNGHIRYE